MGGAELLDQDQASAPVDGGSLNISPPNVLAENNSQGMGGSSNTPVLLELVKQVPPLLSKRPEDMLRFFVCIKEIYRLSFTEDRTFVTLILPLVPAGLLQFLGVCLQDGNT
jgi:hypothetical protein